MQGCAAKLTKWQFKVIHVWHISLVAVQCIEMHQAVVFAVTTTNIIQGVHIAHISVSQNLLYVTFHFKDY
jgi:hypothetical protein